MTNPNIKTAPDTLPISNKVGKFAVRAVLGVSLVLGLTDGVPAILQSQDECHTPPAASALETVHNQFKGSETPEDPQTVARELGVELASTPKPIAKILQSKTPQPQLT